MPSGQELFDDMSVDIGEAEVTPGVVIRQTFMVEAQQVKDGGLKVMDVNLISGDVEAEVIGLAIGSGLSSAACHQSGESLRVMVATRFTPEGGIGFDHGRASEFSSPDDEGFVEEPMAFEILNEGSSGLGGLFTVVLG